MSAPDRFDPDQFLADVFTIFRKRDENGGHLHHRDCIHNLPPEQQVELRGKTVDWWLTVIGPLPEQITPAEWQTEPLVGDHR